MAEPLFEISDKDGNVVQLTTERSELHVVVRHPEVEPYLEQIKQLIESPNIVTKDSRGVYHLSRLAAVEESRFRGLYLEVVVRYRRRSSGAEGEVLTIFFNARPPKGDLEWIRR